MRQRSQGLIARQPAGAIGAQLGERARGGAGDGLQFGALRQPPRDDASKQSALRGGQVRLVFARVPAYESNRIVVW
jgi:hypothetical protein